MTQLFLNKTKQFTSAVQQLDLLSPLKIMGRGYSYTTKEDRVVKTVTELQPADQLTIHYADGTVQANVETITAKKRSFNMPKKRKTFEESLNALEEIVQRLERGDVPLEEALAFQEGMALSKQCQDTLEKRKNFNENDDRKQ